MIYEPLLPGDAAQTAGYVWRLHQETGKQGSSQFKQIDYLPRLPVFKVLRIIDDVRNDFHSQPKRDKLIELLREGVGVPIDMDGIRRVREFDSKLGDAEIADYYKYLDYLTGYAEKIASYMKPWGYLPCSQWVQQAIGSEVWPFYGRKIDDDVVTTTHTFDVPDYAAKAALIYKVTNEDPNVYELVDAYVLKTKGGTVALPATFAMHTTSEKAPEGSGSKKRVQVLRSRIKRTINIAKTLKPGRQYLTLFGLFYFDPPTGTEETTQAKQLKQCLEIDAYLSTENMLLGYNARIQRIAAKVEAARPRYDEARAYLSRVALRFPQGNPPLKVVVASAKAQAVVDDMISKQSQLSNAEKEADAKGSEDSPIRRLSFYALDVMQGTTYRKDENEWHPLPTPKFDVAADRIYGNDKSVKAERQVTAKTALIDGASKRFW